MATISDAVSLLLFTHLLIFLSDISQVIYMILRVILLFLLGTEMLTFNELQFWCISWNIFEWNYFLF